MRLIFLFSMTVFSSAFAAAVPAKSTPLDFHCSNAPASVWGEYYAVSASTTDFTSLAVNSFGLVEGSTSAEEEEPVNTVEEFVSKPNPAAAATSAAWKTAVPFDLTTAELGAATLYLHISEFDGSNKPVLARLKVAGKDVRLTCRY